MNSPLDSDTLVLVTLCGDHDIGLVQHKHFDLLGVYKFEFTAPVQHGTRCTNDYLLLKLHASLHWIRTETNSQDLVKLQN